MARQIGDGSNQISFSNVVDPNDGPGSASIWVYADSFDVSADGNYHTISQQTNGSGSAGRTWLCARRDNNTEYYLSSAMGGTMTQGATDIASRTSEWIHCGLTWSGGGAASTVRVYLDGVEDLNFSTDPEACDGAHLVGRHKSPSESNEEWFGRCAEHPIWDAELTPNEMRMLAAGVSPIRVRAVSLQLYGSLFGTDSPEPDFSGSGSVGSVTGTSQANHAPVAPQFAFWSDHLAATLIVGAGQTVNATLQDEITFTDQIIRDLTVTRVTQDQFTLVDNLDPTVTTSWTLSGVTKDNSGSALGTCEVFLMKDNQDNTLTFVAYTQSDGSGNYTFIGIADNDAQYVVIAWKDDAPHVFDVTDHVLQPT